jgi:hypothetical protein
MATKPAASKTPIAKIKHTFPSGLEVVGTLDELISIAKVTGQELKLADSVELPVGFYLSDSKGLVKLSDMTVDHLKAALLKHTREFFEALSKRKVSKAFLNDYVNIDANKVIRSLYAELVSRDLPEA